MDPRFMKFYSPQQPAFNFLTWDSPQMQLAREALALPSGTVRQAFALGLRVSVRAGETSIDPTTFIWAQRDGLISWARITLPFGTGSWAESAKAISPLALDFLAKDRLAQDIYSLLCAQSSIQNDGRQDAAEQDTAPADFDGFLFIMSAGAVLIRDMTLETLKEDGGPRGIYPILPKPPSEHARLAAIETLQRGIRLLLQHQDPNLATETADLYQIGNLLEV